MCASAADTWSALRAERARVLHLERAVLAQRLQLEKEERVRTQLERRKTLLEREIVRARHGVSTSKIVDQRSLVGFIIIIQIDGEYIEQKCFTNRTRRVADITLHERYIATDRVRMAEMVGVGIADL